MNWHKNVYLSLGQRKKIKVEMKKMWETIIQIRILGFHLLVQLHL